MLVDIYRVVGISKKGTEYQRLELVFDNGYVMKVFLTEEQKVLLKDEVPLKSK